MFCCFQCRDLIHVLFNSSLSIMCIVTWLQMQIFNILFSNYLLLVCKSTIGCFFLLFVFFSLSGLYPASLSNLTIISGIFCRFLRIFYTNNHIICELKAILFLPIWSLHLNIFISCLIPMTRTSNQCWIQRVTVSIFALFPIFGRKCSIFCQCVWY